MSDCFDARKDSPVLRQANAAYIEALMAEMLPALRMAARGSGYALGVHGTLARDIDLLAAPWTEQADSAEFLVQRLCGVVAGFTGRALTMQSWSDKPHGRRAVTIIHGGHDAEIDLSIMPRVQGADQ
jgi:hypothetical protein